MHFSDAFLSIQCIYVDNELIRNITGKNFKNRNLICNGIVPVTPLKDQQNSTLPSGEEVLSPPTSDVVSLSNWVESSEVSDSVQGALFSPPSK